MKKFWHSGSKKMTENSEKTDGIRRHIVFSGQVQGVGFRYYSVQKARALGLTGWVRNLSDGTVEMEVQGREEKIAMLIQFLGSRQWIDIESMDVKNLSAIKEQDFHECW